VKLNNEGLSDAKRKKKNLILKEGEKHE